MSEKLEVSVMTPEQAVYNHDVTMALIPGEDGELGILPNHISMLTRLAPGIINLYEGQKIIKSFFVSHGIAEVSQNKLSLLADKIIDPAKLNVSDSKAKLQELEKQLETSSDHENNKKLFREIAICRKIIEVGKKT